MFFLQLVSTKHENVDVNMYEIKKKHIFVLDFKTTTSTKYHNYFMHLILEWVN